VVRKHNKIILYIINKIIGTGWLRGNFRLYFLLAQL
jgi:hypothetical protein